jgi:hypothetical protein
MKAMKRPVKHEEIADHQLNPLMFRIPALKNRKSSRSNLQQANGGSNVQRSQKMRAILLSLEGITE